MSGPTLVVVGATGAVGTVVRQIIEERPFAWGEIRLVASARSAGRVVRLRGSDVTVLELAPEVFAGADVAVFDVPDELSAQWVPVAVEAGAVAVDNSGAFRMDPEVPLVVPEVNGFAAFHRPKGVVANPNCTVTGLVVVAGALHTAFGLRELVVASYQAASGAGQVGADVLQEQLAAVAGGGLGTVSGDVREVVKQTGPFPAPLALNVIPWAGSLRADGWSSEELKVRNEARKMLGLPGLRVTATCVRVPVVTTHSLAVHAVLDTEVELAEVQAVLAEADGVAILDDPGAGQYPMPIDAVGTDPTWVGRVRVNLDDPTAVELFLAMDNLRKGAALNTLQIAELVAVGRG